MHEQEYLTICLIEELAELQQALSKCLRFGPKDSHPIKKSGKTNLEDANDELSDVIAILTLMQTIGVPLEVNDDRAKAKVDRTLEFLEYSRKLGIVDDADKTDSGKDSHQGS